MATICAVPEELHVPSIKDAIVDGRYNYARDNALREEFLAKLRSWLATAGYAGEGVGEVLRFQVADGYAMYMVAQVAPPKLIHLPLGDAWQLTAAHERGLRAKDVREQISPQHALAALFSSKDSAGAGAQAPVGAAFGGGGRYG